MNVRYLKDICEAYILDNDLKKEVTVEQLYSDIKETLDDIRVHEFDFYHQFNSLSNSQQQRIIKEYFDFDYKLNRNNIDNIFQEEFGPILTGIQHASAMLLVIAPAYYLWKYRKPISKTVFGVIAKVGSIFDSVGKFLVTHGRYWKFRYAIIQQNFEDCYKRCGVTDVKEFGPSAYTQIGSDDSSVKMFSSIEDAKKIKCLSGCYVDSIINTIVLQMKSYFVCLKRAGKFDMVRGMGYDDLVSVTIGVQLGRICQEHYDEARKAIDVLHTLLDFLYDDDQSKKQEWLNRLRELLIRTRNEVSNTNDMNRFR